MDIRQLRYFLAIVEEGSFSRAAQRVHVAQPALSLHVRRMEEALGASLLIRGPGGVVATEEGELLASRARAILADMAQTEEAIRSFSGEPSGTVRLGLPGTISEILSVPLIARAQDLYPGIKIVIAEAMSGFVREWLLDRRVELAVIYSDLRESGVASDMLLEEELVLLMPPDNGSGSSVPIGFLEQQKLILPSEAHGLRAMLDKVFLDAGLSVQSVFEVDSYTNIKRLVEQGYGCSVLPFHAVAAEAAAGTLAVRHFTDAALWRSAYLVQVVSRPATRAAAAISDLVKDIVAELVRDGVWVGARLSNSGEN